MVPFSKSSVCVCHILPPLSWSTHSSLLCLLLPAGTCTSCVVVFFSVFFVFVLCVLFLYLCLNRVGGTCLSLSVSFLFFFKPTPPPISDLMQRLHTIHFLSSLQSLRNDKTPENFLKHPHTVGLSKIAKFDADNLNEITKLRFCVWPFLMSVCFYLLFSSQKCIHTYTKCFAAICTFHMGGEMNVSKASRSNK